MQRCTVHPKDPAAWTCTQCSRALCEHCGYDDFAAKSRVVRCTHCMGYASPIRIYVDIPPFTDKIKPYIRGLGRPDALLSFGAILLLTGVLLIARTIGALISMAIWVTWYLLIIRHASEGGDDLAEPSADRFGGAASGLWRLLWVLSWPLVIGISAYMDAIPIGRTDFTAALWLTEALILAPAWLITAASIDSFLALIDPRTPFRIVWRVGRDYLKLLVVWLGLLAASWAATRLTVVFDRVPVVAFILDQAIFFVTWTTSAFVLGWFVWERAEQLGLRTHEERVRDQIPGAIPRGDRPRHPQAPVPAASTEPRPDDGDLTLSQRPPLVSGPTAPDHRDDHRNDHMDIDALPIDASMRGAPPEGPAATALPTFSGAELPSDPTVMAVSAAPPNAASSTSPSGSSLAEAIESGDRDAAWRIWSTVTQTTNANLIPVTSRFALADLLRDAKPRRAGEVLRTLITGSDSEAAARAVTALAAILRDRLGKPAEADALESAFARSRRPPA
ncbi:MAG: hypothetical protein IV100_18655 [Myxococcales bacterium]|nr:hypothetical protein [Myxococcales bacterium]